MRVYKINNQYIDLDHVLIVSELEFRKEYDETPYDACFHITLAFHEHSKQIGFRFPWDLSMDFIVEEETEKIKQEYEKFLYAWQNK